MNDQPRQIRTSSTVSPLFAIKPFLLDAFAFLAIVLDLWWNEYYFFRFNQTSRRSLYQTHWVSHEPEPYIYNWLRKRTMQDLVAVIGNNTSIKINMMTT